MGKGKRKAERTERRHLRLATADDRPAPTPAHLPLEERPEYQANMKAWRAAGCPVPGEAA